MWGGEGERRDSGKIGTVAYSWRGEAAPGRRAEAISPEGRAGESERGRGCAWLGMCRLVAYVHQGKELEYTHQEKIDLIRRARR
jgi:hypothetical protein